MRYVELTESEFLTDKNEILEWMNQSFLKFDPSKLKIESDGLIYNGDLFLKTQVSKLEVQFKSVTGYFDCYDVKLDSLKGCPNIVGEFFSCSSGTITSLEGCPKSIGSNFSCSLTSITNLKYCPTSIKETFTCYDTKITDPKEYRYVLYSEVGGFFDSDIKEIDNIINTYGGSSNRKHWPYAINLNLLSKVKL